jgi:hypothetical protein
VLIGLTLRSGAAEFHYVVSFKDERMQIAPGTPTEPLADIGFTLTDLSRLLYLPRGSYESTSRDVRVLTWPWNDRSGEITEARLEEMVSSGEATREELSLRGRRRFAVLSKAIQAVLNACSSKPVGLDDLAVRFGSDKWGSLHWYTQHYQAQFAEFRHLPVRLLEIGIGGYNHESLGGESLYMWQRFFPRGLIYGLDIFAKPNVVGPRIRTIQGDQNDPRFLRELGETAGPFDIIVDDGSHINEHVRTSFEHLFPYVRPGGWYVIEDLHTAYWPSFGGNAVAGAPDTTIALLKGLLDSLHQDEHLDPADELLRRPTHPSEIHITHNVAMLRKGINHEAAIPDWIKNRAGRWTQQPARDGSAR